MFIFLLACLFVSQFDVKDQWLLLAYNMHSHHICENLGIDIISLTFLRFYNNLALNDVSPDVSLNRKGISYLGLTIQQRVN